MTIEELIKELGQEQTSGDYISKNLAEILPDSAKEFGELAKSSQEAKYDLFNSLQTLADEAAKLGLTLDVKETRPGNYEIRYLRSKELAMAEAEIEKIKSTIPKFSISRDSHGIGDRYGMKSINQSVMDMKDGLLMIYTKNEQTILDQLNRLKAQGASSYAAKAVAGDDRMYKKFANSIKYTARKTQNSMSSAGSFYAQSDEARKALQGTGSKQSLLARRGYTDMTPVLRALTADTKELHRQYVRQTKRFGAGYLDIQEAIENDVMEMLAIAGQQLEYDNIVSEFQKLRHGSKYEYILKNKTFQQLFFQGINGQKGIAEQINSLHPYIGTSQEGSIGNKLMSFVKNSGLGILGGLDDPSSRKRVQVANILSYDKIKAASKAAREKYTKKGVAFTKGQKSAGISPKDIDQRLYGEIYASAEEIEAAQEALVDELLKDWIKKDAASHKSKDYKLSTAKEQEMRRKFESEVGRYSGAHSGGVLYSKEIEASLDATMQRHIRLSKAAIEEREEYLKTHRKQFAVEKGKKLSDAQLKQVRSMAVRDLIVKETGLKRHEQNLVIFDDIDDALEDVGNGMYGLSYKQAAHMRSGNKILTGNEYDRLTAAGIDPRVIEKIIEARIRNGSLKYAGGAKDYIEKNAIAFVKQAEQMSSRNISGQLEGYVNAVLDYARTNKLGNIFKGNSKLKDWLSVQSDGSYVVNRDIFSVDKKGRTIGGADRRKAMFALINAINKNNDLPEWMKHAFDVVKGGIQRDPTKYIGLTTANQYHDYDYGAPGKTVQTDYRWAGAVRRSAGIAEMATGRSMSELRKLKTAYREGDERDRKNRERLKRLQADSKRMVEATHRTAFSDFSFKKEDLVLSYSPIEGRKALTYNDAGDLVYADTGKPYEGEDNVYLDLNGPYHEINGDDYDKETGGIYKEAFNASVYGALSKFHAARGGRKDVPMGDMYYAPGNKGFLRKNRDGKNVKGRYLALPGFSQEDWRFEDNPDVMMIPPQFSSGIGGVMRADEEYRAIRDGLDPLNPDRKSLERADEDLQEAMIAAMAGYYDDVNNKNGTFFKSGTKVRVQHSMLGKASSSVLKDLSGKTPGAIGNANDLDRLLNVSVLASGDDLRDLLRNDEYDLRTKEGKAKYEDMIRNYLDYVYGDGTEDAIKAWKKGKKKTDVFGLEQFLLDSVTVGTDVFERRLKEAKGDISKMRGLGGEFARFPLSNGLDVKDVDVFAGGAGIAERGTLKVGLGLGRMVNADFDGDRLVLHMDMAEKAGLKNADKKQLNEQKRAAVDLQRDVSLAVGIGELEDLLDKKDEFNTMDSEALKAMFNDQAQQSGAIASRLNKAGTGLLSNNYQALAEMMDYLDQDLAKIDPSNIQAKKNAIQQMAIRNIFESFTQDAISSKKVSQRLAKQYGENFDTDINFLSDLKSLMDLFRAPETYQSRAGLDKAFQKAIDMGIFNAKEGKSPLANRIMAGTMATTQKLFTNKDGSVDKKSLMEIFGIKDEKILDDMLFDFSKSRKGIVERGKLGEKFYFSIDQLKDFMWDFEQKNPGKLAWQQRTRDYLPGHLSAKANVYKTIAGAELTKEEYDSLSPEIKGLYEEYDSLAESAGKAKDAINAEAAAEQAKIKIADEEGDAVDKLTKKYEGLHETAKDLADALKQNPNYGGKSVSALLTDVFGNHFTTDVSGFDKAVSEKLDEIRGRSRKGTAEEKAKSIQRDIARVGKDPAKALGYGDAATFENFAKEWVATIVGRIADSLEQGLIAAAKADEDWTGVSDYAGLVDLKAKIESRAKKEGKKGGAFTDLLSLLTDKDDGIFSLVEKYGDILTMVFGKKEGERTLYNALRAGEGMRRSTLAMAGGDIRNVGQSEGNIIGLLAGRRIIHGRFDRLTSNNVDQEYQDDLTGERVAGAVRNVTVSDKKYAMALTDQYIAQQIAYVRSLEQIRDWGLSGEGGTDRTYKEFLNSDLANRVTDRRGRPLSKKAYYDLLGFDTAEGDDETKWRRISKGAAVTSKISLMNKKTGKAEIYNIGRTYRDKYTGEMKTIFGDNEEQSGLIERLLAAGVSFDEWGPALKQAFKNSAHRNTDPNYNFEYTDVLRKEEEKKVHSENVTNALSANLKIFRSVLKARDQAQAELDLAVEEGAPAEHVQELIALVERQTKELNDTKQETLKNEKEYEKLHPLRKGKERTAAEKKLLIGEKGLEREEKTSEKRYVTEPRKRRAEARNIRLKREADSVYGKLADARYQAFAAKKDAAEDADLAANEEHRQLIQFYEDEETLAKAAVEEYEKNIENSTVSWKEQQKKIAAESKERAERNLDIKEKRYSVGSSKKAEARNIRLKREADSVYGKLGSAQLQLFVAEQKAARNTDPAKSENFQNIVEYWKDEVTLAKDKATQYEQSIENSDAYYKDFQKKIAAEAKEKMERELGVKKDKWLTGDRKDSSVQRSNGFLGINTQVIRWVDRLMAGGAFQKFLQLVKTGMGQMVQKAKELDAAMTNLRIVTGDSASDAKNMMSQYSKLAKELGSTTTEVTNAATEWLRQGYETAEVTDLITASMYLSKLGMIDSTTATKDLTSAMKGFKIEASDAMDIVDKLTSIDLEAATSAGEIAEGLAQFSNMATLSGVDIDQAAAYVATIADVTQSSGSTVGNAMKTIISRYGNVKAGAYNELNVSDETTDTSESLNDVEKVLHKLGIDIRDTNLEFKDFDVVLDEIADKWDSLDNVSKKAIANAFAGTRQQEAFTTLMENYDKYQDLLETSQSSSGTAETKYKSYRESYQAAQQELTAAFEGLVNNTPLNNILTDLTKALTWLVDKLDKYGEYIPGILSSLLSTLAAFNRSPVNAAFSRYQEYVASRKETRERLHLQGLDDYGLLSSEKVQSTKPGAWLAKKLGIYKEKPKDGEKAEDGKVTDGKDADAIVQSSQEVTENFTKTVDASKEIKENLQEAAKATKEEKEDKEAVAEKSSEEKENKEAVKEASEGEKDDKDQIKAAGDSEKADKDQVKAAGASESSDKNAVAADAGSEKSDKDAVVVQADSELQKKEQVAAVNANGSAPAANAGAADSAGGLSRWGRLKQNLKGTKANGLVSGAQMALNSTVAGVTGYLSGTATHSNAKGDTVSSSEGAKDASRWMTASAGVVSAVPFIGGILSVGLTNVAKLIAQNYDKYRDQAASATEEANENLNLLDDVGSDLSNLAEADLSSEEGREAASDLLTELYSEDGQKTMKLLNQYLGPEGGTDTVYSLLSTIKDDTASISEKTAAMRKLQLAELEAEKGQISNKYASQMYDNSQQEAEQYAEVADIRADDVAFGTGLGTAAAGSTIGVAAGAGIGLATVAIMSNPIGWVVGAIAAVAAVGVSIAAAVKNAEAASEEASANRARQDAYNAMSTSEKIVYLQDQMDTLIERASDTGADVSDEVGKYQALIDTLVEQNALINQMNDEIDDITLQQGVIDAKYEANGETQYLSDMTTAQLKNMGIDEILKLYAQAIERNGGLIGADVWASDDGGEHEKLSDAGFSYLRRKLKEQGDEEINAVLNGYSYTLSEALKMGAKYGGQTWYEELLQSFASALDVPKEQLSEINDMFGSLTLADAVASTADLTESISSYIDLLGDIAEGAGEVSGWMETIISQFPELTAYLGNTPKMFSKIGEKLTALSEKYLKSQYDDIMSTDAFYTEIKDSFYQKLTEKAGGTDRLTSILDAQPTISSANGVMSWLKTQYDSSGNLTGDAGDIYDALVATVSEYGTEAVSSILKDYYDLLIDFKTQTLDTEIDNLTEQKEALEEINSQREYENRLIEAKLKLESASKEKKRVYRAGVGWVYEEDQEAIKEAQDELDELGNEQTVSGLEQQIAELEQQKSDLESVYDKQNYETLQELYNAFVNENPNADFLSSIVAGVSGISEKISEMIGEQAATDAGDKNAAIQTAADKWKALTEADPSDGRAYNAALEDYQIAAKAAVSAGAGEGDFKSFQGSTKTANGKTSAWDVANGTLNEMKVSEKYSIKIPDNDHQHWEGFADISSVSTDTTIQGWIFDDIKKRQGYIVTKDGKVISPMDNSHYAPISDDDNLSEYAERLSTKQSLTDAIYVGWGGDNEALWYHNGEFYKITSDKATNGLTTVEGALAAKDVVWPGTEAAVSKAAEGSYGLPGGATLVNELGTEAIITPMGTLTSLPSGTGVVPADITKNLWALGEVAPGILRTLELTMAPDTIGKPSWSQSTDESFSIGNLTMNVTADGGFDVDEFVDSIKQRAALTKNLAH